MDGERRPVKGRPLDLRQLVRQISVEPPDANRRGAAKSQKGLAQSAIAELDLQLRVGRGILWSVELYGHRAGFQGDAR